MLKTKQLCGASKEVYCAVVYIPLVKEDIIIFDIYHVAPLKQVTLPWSELCAVELSVQLADCIKDKF